MPWPPAKAEQPAPVTAGHGTSAHRRNITAHRFAMAGGAYVENNAGPKVTKAGNTATGSLYCTGNNPRSALRLPVPDETDSSSKEVAGVAAAMGHLLGRPEP